MGKSLNKKIIVTTLGTGTPILNPKRASQSILVEAAGHRLLFDTGRNIATRLVQAKVKPSSVEQVFFTHFHSDHTVGFADFWLSSWIPAGGARTSPLNVSGPSGTLNLIEGHRIAFGDDIKIRTKDQGLPKSGVEINVKEFDECGIVFDQDGIVVTSFEVDHGEAIKPNWGYKIEYSGHIVVISGDSKNDNRVSQIAKGADLLFHSLGTARKEIQEYHDVAAILQHHTTPSEAANIFTISKPKLAVLVHMVLLGKPNFPPMSADEVLRAILEIYDGPITIAEDLMRFEISEKVKVVPYYS